MFLTSVLPLKSYQNGSHQFFDEKITHFPLSQVDYTITFISQSINDRMNQQMQDKLCNFVIQQDDSNYNWIRIMRLSIILFSVICLIINVAIIIRRKQYKFNTIKLFMFVEICWMLSQLSVTPHDSSFNYSLISLPKNITEKQLMNCMIAVGSQYKCAIEGFVNMLCYSLSYWFAVCITLYIRHVLQNTHKQFIRKRGAFIFLIITIIIIWYLVPFVLTFLNNVPFSFGPTGYIYQHIPYFFYAGFVDRSQGGAGIVLVVVWMLFLPAVMFIYHAHLLYRNRISIKKLQALQQINPRQWFIIRTGNLSFVIFLVQVVNVGKLALALPGVESIEDPLFYINTIFDLLSLILIFIYFRFYYRQGQNLQQSPIMGNSMVQSFTSVRII